MTNAYNIFEIEQYVLAQKNIVPIPTNIFLPNRHKTDPEPVGGGDDKPSQFTKLMSVDKKILIGLAIGFVIVGFVICKIFSK